MIYNITVSSEEIAEILKIKNRNYISELVSDHNFPKVEYNKYPLVAFMQRWIEYQKELHAEEIKRIRERDAKNRLDNINAELKEIDLEIKLNNIIEADHLKEVLENETHIYIKSIELLRTKLPNVLNLTEQQREALNNELTSIREQIGNLPANIQAINVELN